MLLALVLVGRSWEGISHLNMVLLSIVATELRRMILVVLHCPKQQRPKNKGRNIC